MNDSRLKRLLPKRWKMLFAIPLIISGTMGASCSAAPIFKWNPEIYATDSREQVIVREKPDHTLDIIPTSDPRFDGYICIKADEPGKAQQAYFDVINECEKWKVDRQGRK